MTGSLLTPENIERIDPLDVRQYLEESGWSLSGSIDNKAVIYSRDDYYGDIIAPISMTLKDYRRRYVEVIESLAEYSNRDVNSVVQDLVNFGADIARFRIESPKTEDGTMPVEDAVKFYSNVKHIIIASGRSVIETKHKYSSNVPEKVQKLYEGSRVGQTEVGSYIINVILRHTRSDTSGNRLLRELPFERLTFETMNRAIHKIDSITDGHVRERAIEESIYDGVSYNLCKHLSEMQEISQGGSINISFKFSSRYSKPESAPDDIVLEYQQQEGIKRVAEVLSTEAISEEKTLYGFVIGLLKPKDHNEGKVTIHAYYEGRTIRVSLTLKIGKYTEAVKAHETDVQIRCVGVLKRVGNYFYMERISRFELMERPKLL